MILNGCFWQEYVNPWLSGVNPFAAAFQLSLFTSLKGFEPILPHRTASTQRCFLPNPNSFYNFSRGLGSDISSVISKHYINSSVLMFFGKEPLFRFFILLHIQFGEFWLPLCSSGMNTSVVQCSPDDELINWLIITVREVFSFIDATLGFHGISWIITYLILVWSLLVDHSWVR